MTPVRRLMGVLMLAGLLSSGFANAAPQGTAPEAARAEVVQGTQVSRAEARAQLCAHLADYIKRVQALPAGPLRDALLRFALALQAQFCA